MASFRRDMDPTYKAKRPSIAQRRQRHREQVWENSDPPGTWLLPMSEELQAQAQPQTVQRYIRD